MRRHELINEEIVQEIIQFIRSEKTRKHCSPIWMITMMTILPRL